MVFWDHMFDYGTQLNSTIKTLIAIRKRNELKSNRFLKKKISQVFTQQSSCTHHPSFPSHSLPLPVNAGVDSCRLGFVCRTRGRRLTSLSDHYRLLWLSPRQWKQFLLTSVVVDAGQYHHNSTNGSAERGEFPPTNSCGTIVSGAAMSADAMCVVCTATKRDRVHSNT